MRRRHGLQRLLRICPPKVGLTLVTLTSAPSASLKDSADLRTSPPGSAPECGPRSRSPAVWITASRATKPGSACRTSPSLSSRSGLATVNLAPPSKSMPKFRFPSGDRRDPGQEQHARDGEPQLPPPDEVDLRNPLRDTAQPSFFLDLVSSRRPSCRREMEAAAEMTRGAPA